MSKLFPDRPAYVRITRGAEFGQVVQVAAVVCCSAGVVSAFCPLHDKHTHVPHQEYVQATVDIAPLASGSSSGSASDVPMTWQNSSIMEAANVVARLHRERRNALTRIAASSSGSMNAALFG